MQRIPNCRMRILPAIDRSISLAAYAAILFYRRYISRHKGFRCAHAAVTGGPSCSQIAANILREQTFSIALPVIRTQRASCREAYEVFLLREASLAENLLNSAIFAQQDGGNFIVKCC